MLAPALVLPALMLLALALPAAAQSPQPLPKPDLTALPAAAQTELREARANFDRTAPTLTGTRLAEGYADLGAAYARAGLFDVAAVALANAAQVTPQDGRWPYVQGVLARLLDRRDQAKAFFEKAYKLNPDYLPGRVALAGARMQANDFDGARGLLAPYVAGHKSEPAPFAVLADIALQQKRYADAVTNLETALKLDPKATQLYASLAAAQAGAGNTEAAKAAQARAGNVPVRLDDPLMRRLLPAAPVDAATVDATPAVADPYAEVAATVARALAEGRLDAARGALDAALKQKPNDPVLLANYARVDAAAGDFKQAAARSKAALAVAPRNSLALLNHALVLEMSGDDAGAHEAYQKAVAAEAPVREAYFRYGNLLMRTGRPADAAAQYRTLATLVPDDGEAWARLLAADVAAGQCATGLKDITTGFAQHPTDRALVQLYVRATSTCAAASAEERRKALEHAVALYRSGSGNAAQVGEAYALALAANGKWDDAVQTQGAAMYDLIRAGDQATVALFREFLQKFQAKQLPDRPWPADHPLFKPLRPAPNLVPAR